MFHYDPAPDLLQDRTVLITGAGTGLGRAAALAYARHGATVILLGRTVAKLEAVYDEIEQAGGPEPAIYPMDLTGAGPDDYADLAHTVEQNFGRLDGLLHNAATLGALTPIEHYDTETWYRTVQINLHAPFLLTRACLPLLRQAPDAAVVFSSDRVGREGKAYWGAYGVAKFGLEGLMQILAEELETNTPVRVNSLDPGPVRTELRLLAYPGEDRDSLLQPEDVMPLYLYLMGPDSRGTTGRAWSAQGDERPAH